MRACATSSICWCIWIARARCSRSNRASAGMEASFRKRIRAGCDGLLEMPRRSRRHEEQAPRLENEMTQGMQYSESDPRHHALRIKGMLQEAMQHSRQDVARVSDPKAQALFEPSAD